MKIIAVENGPFIMEVEKSKLTKDGKEEELNVKKIALCRCGHSENKPFCDGKHRAHGFTAESSEIEFE
jgi:CDGSH-type Zn-finger protein